MAVNGHYHECACYLLDDVQQAYLGNTSVSASESSSEAFEISAAGVAGDGRACGGGLTVKLSSDPARRPRDALRCPSINGAAIVETT